MRPSLIFATVASRKAGSLKKGFVIGVSMNVGAIVLTRMPCDARSSAIALLRPSRPHFVAQYSVRRGPPTCPICEDMLHDGAAHAVCDHPRRDGLGREKGRAQIEIGDGVVIVARDLEEMFRPVGAGVVDEDVRRRATGDRGREGGRVRHVGDDRVGAAARRADRGGDGFDLVARSGRRASRARRPPPDPRRRPRRCLAPRR